jgi:arabinofuranosyltransferase
LENTRDQELVRWGLWLLVGLYVALQITHAWVLDDAYITLRTVDNFVNGLGLRWNPVERVQSYTHPLWMFALSAVYFVTREAYYSTLLLAFVTSLAALVVVLRWSVLKERGFRAILFMAVLLGSKSFTDYSSSGLENPLTHLLLALFFTRWLSAQRDDRLRLFLLAALAFVNRMDTILFFAPALMYLLWEQRGDWRSALRDLFVGSLPAIAWVLFSLLYYGVALPNTAIAKVTGARVTLVERVQSGLSHLVDSLLSDPLTLIVCVLAVALAVASRRPRVVVAASGAALYLIYFFTTGAIGTHMGGRFFSGPLFLSAIVLACLAHDGKIAQGAVAVAAFWMIGSPVSPLRVGFNNYPHSTADRGVGDVRKMVEDEGAALLSVHLGESMPRHAWYNAGLEYRDNPERVHVGGLGTGGWAMGYGPFAAGPNHFIIDTIGLTDPLIARLPMPRRRSWYHRPGHFPREIPAGYPESAEAGKNLIVDPDLKRYYDVILILTRDPVFSLKRLGTIVSFNLGKYDGWLNAYAERQGLRSR